MSDDTPDTDESDEPDNFTRANPEPPQTFEAPPELVVDDRTRNILAVLYPVENDQGHIDGVKTWNGSQWRCQRCGGVNSTSPTQRGGEVTRPGECHSCEREGPFTADVAPASIYTPNDVEKVLSANPVYEPAVIGDWGEWIGLDADPPTFESVYNEIREYFHRYWAAGDGREWMYDMLTCFAMSTWFRERLDFLPHLLILGKHETGKTRLLNTLRNVSYRGVHTASLTPAYVYRGIDAHDISLYISEYHDLGEDSQRDVDAVVKAGQKRGEVIGRATESGGGEYDIENFDPFSHVAISTQYPPDDDIISRCFEIRTQPAKRSMPRVLKKAPQIRSKLLYLRYRYLFDDKISESATQAESYLDDRGVFNRLSEKLWCLVQMGVLADTDLDPFVNAVIGRDRERAEETEEANFLRAVLDEAFEQLYELSGANEEMVDDTWENLTIPLSNVKSRFENLTSREVSPTYIGIIRDRLGLDKKRLATGTTIHDENLKTKLKELCDQNGVEWAPTPGLIDDMDATTVTDLTDQQLADSDADADADDGDDTGDIDTGTTTHADRVEAIREAIDTLYDGEPVQIDDLVAHIIDTTDHDPVPIRNQLSTLTNQSRIVRQIPDTRKLEPAD